METFLIGTQNKTEIFRCLHRNLNYVRPVSLRENSGVSANFFRSELNANRV